MLIFGAKHKCHKCIRSNQYNFPCTEFMIGFTLTKVTVFDMAFLNDSYAQQINNFSLSLKVPSEALKDLQNSTKSILKKPNSSRKKSNSHVNYSFESDDIPNAGDKYTKKKKPKSATVIDKRTGKSKQIVIEDSKAKTEHVINVEIH